MGARLVLVLGPALVAAAQVCTVKRVGFLGLRTEKTCVDNEELEIPEFLTAFWPPSADKWPQLIGIAMLMVVFVLNALRHKKTEADVQYEERRMQQVMDQLAQVEVEHEENQTERKKYFERKEKLETHAKQRAEESNSDWETIFRDAAAASGFADEELKAPLPPERLLEAIMDKINDCPLDVLPGLAEKLGADRLEHFNTLFDSVHAKLLVRQTEVLTETMTKTTAARAAKPGQADLAFSSGQKLSDVLEHAKRVDKLFYNRRMYVLPPRARAADPTKFKAELAASKKLHRVVKLEQTSRFMRLMSYLDTSTLVYVGLLALTKVVYAFVGPLEQHYQSALGEHALMDDWENMLAQAKMLSPANSPNLDFQSHLELAVSSRRTSCASWASSWWIGTARIS